MLPPPPGTSAIDQIPPGTPNPNLAAAKAGWDQINAYVNGGMVSGINDLEDLKAQLAVGFDPGSQI
jgi:hypothetical protein